MSARRKIASKAPVVSTRRKLVGEARASAALEHLTEARNALDAACRDLCSVEGAREAYREIAQLSNRVVVARGRLDMAFALQESPFALDREPTDEEIDKPHAGCKLQ